MNITQCEALDGNLCMATQPLLVNRYWRLLLPFSRLLLQFSLAYGSYLTNVLSPLLTSVIAVKAKEKLIAVFRYTVENPYFEAHKMHGLPDVGIHDQ